MEPVGSNAALVIWSQEKLVGQVSEDLLPELKPKLEARRAIMDQACEAVLSGPIVWDLSVAWSGELMNTNVGTPKSVSIGLDSRVLLELHNGNRDAAWT